MTPTLPPPPDDPNFHTTSKSPILSHHVQITQTFAPPPDDPHFYVTYRLPSVSQSYAAREPSIARHLACEWSSLTTLLFLVHCVHLATQLFISSLSITSHPASSHDIPGVPGMYACKKLHMRELMCVLCIYAFVYSCSCVYVCVLCMYVLEHDCRMDRYLGLLLGEHVFEPPLRLLTPYCLQH